MNKMTVRDIDVAGKRVLLRVDFNVPMDKNGVITDDGRIRASLSTIRHLIETRSKVIIMSHLGRPDGKVVESMRMAPVATRLSELIGLPIATAPDCVGPEAEKAVAALKDGQVLLLENLRFHAEEEKGTPEFAMALARLGDVYVNDAFGTCHRPHASISVIAQYLPAVAGFLLEKEINTLGSLVTNPVRPFVALLGGAKVSDKVRLMENIMGKVDALLIGGGMAATFLKAKGLEVGKSFIEADRIETASKLIAAATRSGTSLLLPVDVMIADEIKGDAKTDIVAVEKVPREMRIVDIGPRTVEIFRKELGAARTVFWNGPVGIYEVPTFAGATKQLANIIASLHGSTIIGGGSTAEAIEELRLADKITFVSTGGGASLQFLGGEKLPGVEALLDRGAGIRKPQPAAGARKPAR